MIKISAVTAVLVMVAAWVASVFGSAPVAVVEPAADEYVVTTSDQEGGPHFRPLSGDIVVLHDSDDGVHQAPIGFPIEFFGATHRTVNIGVNGGLVFGGDELSYEPAPLDLVDRVGIFPLWNDWTTTGDDRSFVRYGTVGAAPTRVFVVEWVALAHYRTDPAIEDPVTFQAQLREADGAIEFHYADAVAADLSYDSGAGATIGLDGGQARQVQLSYDRASVTSEFAVRFEPRSCCAAGETGPGDRTPATELVTDDSSGDDAPIPTSGSDGFTSAGSHRSGHTPPR